MKVAEKVILLLNGGDGFSAAIAGGLHPIPKSNFQTLNDSFELPLECYGVKDRKVSGEITHFVGTNGQYELNSVVIVLLKFAGEDLSAVPTIIVPFLVPESKLKLENRYTEKSEKVSVYGIKLGPTTDVSQALSSRLQKSPPVLQIYHEGLAMLLHLVNVMKLPTVMLVTG
ncbi:hypothetical protein Sango_1251300 [Sesamum angolense]|uniref:DUF7894 domain-containing protein n=1 Tax=Sesamum angolense TaxID=2727404 RepID=A0AAE2BU78_9LAMI|nr:hypothetical protein Sango_1251300 [Sesamum angolense]